MPDSMGDMGDLLRYAFFPSRQPPQSETKKYDITSEVVILLLQGLAVMLLVAIGMALGFAVVVHELQFSPGLDVAIVRVILCSALLIGSVLAGLSMTVWADLRAGVVFMALGWLLGGLVYQLIPGWAETAGWPWALLFGAISFNYGGYYTRNAFKSEIEEPFERGMPATERVKLEFLQWMMEQQQAAAAPKAAVDVWIEAANGQVKIASLPGTLADVEKFCRAAIDGNLALDKTLPRAHPIWAEVYSRGLIAPRDSNKPTLGSVSTVAGRHVFERVLAELTAE